MNTRTRHAFLATTVLAALATILTCPAFEPPAAVLPGVNADPHIAVFGDTYYIYPTTDGTEGWRSTSFRAWSSRDLVSWRDEGVILDLPRDIKWADIHAWAPAIATKNDRYYYYFSADKNIGVAVADKPTGPFHDPLGRPLVPRSLFPDMQAIDPMVFVDDDGAAYLYWGNGRCKAVRLHDDMISFDPAAIVDLTPPGYCEGSFVHKRDGVYYLTWSEFDTRDPRYSVAYATGKSPLGPFVKTPDNPILRQRGNILGAGHHSIVRIPGRDEWVIAYHRFRIPDGNGYNRETCLSPLRHGPGGRILPVDVFEPALPGVQPPSVLRIGESESERSHNLEGEKTRTGEFRNRRWRDAHDGGWFAFDMPVHRGAHNALEVTYWGGEPGNRAFDILIDGALIGTQHLRADAPGNWFEQVYPIARELTNDKDTVRVRFQALPGHIAGAVYHCRAVSCDPSETQSRNPAFQGADPDVLLVDDTVWIYPTHRDGAERRFFAYSSRDLVNWRIHGPIFEFSNADWIPPGKLAWAPGIARKGEKFYLYYSVGPKPSHIGVAVSDSPSGPFVDSGKALLSDHGNPEFETIDAMVFTDPKSGTSFLYAGGSAGAKLLVYELNEDMVSLKRRIQADTPEHFTEGAFMHFHDGVYYLSYSHGVWWDGTYTVRYATSETPYGPWTYQGVIMSSDDRHRGPGHHSILQLPNGNRWAIVYHRWNDKRQAGPYEDFRQVAIEALDYDESGRIKPVAMTDHGAAMEVQSRNQAPAGEGPGILPGVRISQP